MSMVEMIKEGLRIARTSRALWLFGFFFGLGSVTGGGNHGQPPGGQAAHATAHALTGPPVLGAVAILALIVAGVFLYFLSEGALIEGVAQVRGGKHPTLRECWRFGLAHCGVLFRITALYLAATAGSLIALTIPVLLALKLSGAALAVIVAIPAVVIAVPWLATLYMWRAFAARIAVLENRHAADAVTKARLFLIGRLFEGLKLIVAAILGQLVVVLVGALGFAAVALVAVALHGVFGVSYSAVPVALVAVVTLLPLGFLLFAVSGTTQSSIWTIGYLTAREH
jgi:hypothetical protein